MTQQRRFANIACSALHASLVSAVLFMMPVLPAGAENDISHRDTVTGDWADYDIF